MLARGNQWTEEDSSSCEGSSENTERLKQDDDTELKPEWQSLKQTRIEVNEIKVVDNISQQSTRNRGKTIVNSSAPIYDQEPATVIEDDEMSKEKEIDKNCMALISSLVQENLQTTIKQPSNFINTSRENQDYSQDSQRNRYDNQRAVNVAGARENVGTQIQSVFQIHVDNSGPIFDDEPMHKVQDNNDNYNVFSMENEHPKQPESSNDIYLKEQGDTNITIDSSDICYDKDQDDTDDLDQEHDLLASLIEKLKCEIDDNKTIINF
ncbi:hypothetical protein Tco_0721007 [Tanacetum coccineum]